MTVYEAFDSGSKDSNYVTFYLITSEDEVFFGQLFKKKKGYHPRRIPQCTAARPRLRNLSLDSPTCDPHHRNPRTRRRVRLHQATRPSLTRELQGHRVRSQVRPRGDAHHGTKLQDAPPSRHPLPRLSGIPRPHHRHRPRALGPDSGAVHPRAEPADLPVVNNPEHDGGRVCTPR